MTQLSETYNSRVYTYTGTLTPIRIYAFFEVRTMDSVNPSTWMLYRVVTTDKSEGSDQMGARDH